MDACQTSALSQIVVGLYQDAATAELTSPGSAKGPISTRRSLGKVPHIQRHRENPATMSAPLTVNGSSATSKAATVPAWAGATAQSTTNDSRNTATPCIWRSPTAERDTSTFRATAVFASERRTSWNTDLSWNGTSGDPSVLMKRSTTATVTRPTTGSRTLNCGHPVIRGGSVSRTSLSSHGRFWRSTTERSTRCLSS